MGRFVGAAAAGVVFELAYLIAYKFAMSVPTTTAASPLWFPDAVLLCALLIAPRGRWWLFLLGIAPIRALVAVPELPAWFLLSVYLNDCLKALLAAWLLRHSLKNPARLDDTSSFSRFVLVAVFLAPMLSAFAGAASRNVLGAPYWSAWRQWFLGDALAVLFLAPAILSWFFMPYWRNRPPTIARIAEGFALAVGLIAVESGARVANLGSPWGLLLLLYAPMPFLLWAGVRFGLRGASGALCAVALFAIEAAARSRGPFSGRYPEIGVVSLQMLLFEVGLSILFLAVIVGERNRSEAYRREAEERYREVVESQQELICRFLPDGTLTFVNAACCRYFGRHRTDLLGHRFLDWIPGHPREEAASLIRDLELHPRVGAQEFRVSVAGEERWLQWSSHPVVSAGGVCEFQAVGRDVTDRKRVEEAQEAMERVSRLAFLGKISASISHEINQPLSAILSNAEAAQMLLDSGTAGPAELRSILDDIREDDQRATEVVHRVRSLLRSQVVRTDLVELRDVVSEVLDILRAEIGRRGISLKTEFESQLGPVRADHAQVRQAILNLVMNGLDAMADAVAPNRLLTVSTRMSADGYAEVGVCDSGAGVPPEVLPHLFESFFTTKKQGMGLGLFLCRSIAEGHGGTVVAQNNTDSGATFRLRLPSVSKPGAAGLPPKSTTST